MEKIVFAGSFDPLTNGHLWVIQEGLNIAKEVIVFVAENNAKKTMFSAQECLEMIQKTCSALPNGNRISVMIINNEYTARKAIQIGATHLIRGIRSSGDFDYDYESLNELPATKARAYSWGFLFQRTLHN